MPALKRKSTWIGVWIFWLGVMTLTLFGTAPKVEAQALPEEMVLDNFPIFAQWYNLSCEYSSTRMMTAYWNREINDTQFIKLIGFDPNPHLGFRGDINGPFGGTWDYGIYAEPIALALENQGFESKLLVNGVASLKEELALGRPVQVWVIAGMSWGNPFRATHEGLSFILAGGEHSVVVYGYDPNGVYIADPAYGGRSFYDWDTFLGSWSNFDQMAMSIWPANNQPENRPGVSAYFYRHWLNSGGLTRYGVPLGPATLQREKVSQYFERARMEYDLNKSHDQPIALGLLGTELTKNRLEEKAFQPVSSITDTQEVRFFPQTNHSIMLGFKAYWEQNGELAALGYPLSQEFTENGITVQYFERVRLEYHPNNPDPYKILIGRLGAERLAVAT
jgi:uncharacterized protein YvpB